MDKICPLLTMMSVSEESIDHYEEPCMGEKCAWYEKCFPVITYVSSQPQYPIDEPQFHPPPNWQYTVPDIREHFTAGTNAEEAS